MNPQKTVLQEGIEVDVHPHYLPEHSNPAHAEYAFSYTVFISNHSNERVQLLTRHWIITDGNNCSRAVEGQGVVGKQPYILPGETYRYRSGAILATKTGSMEGRYHMCSESGVQFDTPIPPFGLIRPGSLQ